MGTAALGCRPVKRSTATVKLNLHASLPRRSDLLNPSDRRVQSLLRRRKRKAHKVFSLRSERSPRNRGYPRLLQHDATDFFRAHSRVRDVHPRIKSSFWSVTAKARYFIQLAHELFPALGKLRNHSRRRPGAVFQSLDGAVLAEFRHARVTIHNQHL